MAAGQQKSPFKNLAWPQFWYLIMLHQSLWELFGPGPAMLTSATARKLSLRHSWGFWDCKLHGILSQVILLPSEKKLYMYVYIYIWRWYIYIYIDIGDRLQYGKKWESAIISLLAFFASCLKMVFRNNIYLSYACGGWEFAEGCLFLLMAVKAQVLHHDPFVTKVTHKFAMFNGFFGLRLFRRTHLPCFQLGELRPFRDWILSEVLRVMLPPRQQELLSFWCSRSHPNKMDKRCNKTQTLFIYESIKWLVWEAACQTARGIIPRRTRDAPIETEHPRKMACSGLLCRWEMGW